MSDSERRRQPLARIRNMAGLALFLIAFAASAAYVFYQSFIVDEADIAGGRKTIRFAHWQLEGSTVEAMNWAADEYMKLHPDVYVQQIPIPEPGYRQWVRTQLIGRMALDLIENTFSANMVVRYFLPISDVAERPNPYNKGTELENVPWRETYIDGMKGGWIPSLQEYYTMPLSVFTIRIYANEDLLEEVSGGPVRQPRTLQELFDLCEKVKAYARRTGRRVVPLAGSDYTADVFRYRYWAMSTWGLLDVLDTNLDGSVSLIEQYEAVMDGAVDLRTDPHIRAAYQVLFELSRYFNPGFMSAKRDQSTFLFAQGNAAMVATGTWDAGSLYKQVEGDFRIVVFDFPIADPKNPKYGKYIRYRMTEAGVKAGFPFALSRQSKNRALAIDFMQFLSSRKKVLVNGKLVGMNEELNRRFRWFPATVGARPDKILKPFTPKVEGIYRVFEDSFGPDTKLCMETSYKAYVGEDEPSEAEYAAYMAKTGRSPGDYTYRQYIEDWRNRHWRKFINKYAANIERDAPADMRKAVRDSYMSIVQSETSLASARNRAVRAGLTADPEGDVRRNLKALIFGQARRTVELADMKRRMAAVARHRASARGTSR